MANTFIKIYLHVVFAVKYRDSAIPPTKEKEMHDYIRSLLVHFQQHPIIIGGTSNHIHILFNYENLDQRVNDLIREIKSRSSKWFNEQRFIKCHFAWQRGYACMSYSPSHIEPLKSYIANQHQHHNNMSLEDEIKKMLERFDIPFDPRYIIREE